MALILHRILVVLLLPANVPALIKLAQAILAAMTNNPHFPTTIPPLSELADKLAKLVTAETATQTRTKGTAQARNAARLELVQVLHALKAYVQTVADADPDNAETIIASAGMQSKRKPVRAKPPLAVKAGKVSGTVEVVARAVARRASYEWAWSADGGKTWTALAPTMQAKTSISGLAAGSTVDVRFRGLTRTGLGDWSQTVTFVVK